MWTPGLWLWPALLWPGLARGGNHTDQRGVLGETVAVQELFITTDEDPYRSTETNQFLERMFDLTGIYIHPTSSIFSPVISMLAETISTLEDSHHNSSARQSSPLGAGLGVLPGGCQLFCSSGHLLLLTLASTLCAASFLARPALQDIAIMAKLTAPSVVCPVRKGQ